MPCSIYGRGHVVLPWVVTSSVASTWFFFAGGGRICVVSRAFLAGGCTYAFEAARQGKTAVVTVTKLAIQFDKLRRRPGRDSHGTCRLSGDVHPPSWPVTTPPANGVRHGSPRFLARDCRRRVHESSPPRVHLPALASRPVVHGAWISRRPP